MHGHRREGVAPPSAAQQLAAHKKAEAYRGLARLALRQAAASAAAPSAAAAAALAEGGTDLSAQLLALNPEFYSLWNHRRRLLLLPLPPQLSPPLSDGTAPAGADAAEAAPDAAAAASTVPMAAPAPSARLLRELAVTEAAIARNAKSYHAWHHRQWAAATLGGLGGAAPSLDAAAELVLCARLLDLDERNFHCWNYRRWVVDTSALGNVPASSAAPTPESATAGCATSSASAPTLKRLPPPLLGSELDYTLERIKRNFSNYSSWHQRAALLARRDAPAPVSVTVLAAELAIVRQAVFTEPDDQSPWFYRRWVVAEACRHARPDLLEDGLAGVPADAVRALLGEDCAHLHSLSAAEPACKWPLSALVHTQQTFARAVAPSQAPLLWAGAQDEVGVAALLRRLRTLDPLHDRYYAHLESL